MFFACNSIELLPGQQWYHCDALLSVLRLDRVHKDKTDPRMLRSTEVDLPCPRALLNILPMHEFPTLGVPPRQGASQKQHSLPCLEPEHRYGSQAPLIRHEIKITLIPSREKQGGRNHAEWIHFLVGGQWLELPPGLRGSKRVVLAMGVPCETPVSSGKNRGIFTGPVAAVLGHKASKPNSPVLPMFPWAAQCP